MKRVTQLRIEYHVVTPAFPGGADPRHAELRSPSIKAALLFGAAENSYDARQHRDRGAVLPKVGSMQVQS